MMLDDEDMHIFSRVPNSRTLMKEFRARLTGIWRGIFLHLKSFLLSVSPFRGVGTISGSLLLWFRMIGMLVRAYLHMIRSGTTAAVD
jgi:hypothetical protein